MLILEKLVARNLGCSRKEARYLLAAKGRKIPDKVPPEALPYALELAGRTVTLRDSFHLLLNKPAGCITALSDPEHNTTAALVSNAPLFPELRPVGRLDQESTGLLLFTTDGLWLHRLTHPRSQIPRGYQAALARPFLAPPKEFVLRDGHRPCILDLRVLAPDELHPSLLRPKQATPTTFASITIAGGAYHEVRRIFAALGSHVLSLCRVSFGQLALPMDLGSGQWRAVQQEAVKPHS